MIYYRKGAQATKKKATAADESSRRATAVSDEEITAALLSNGTIIAAAQVLGIGQRTIYDRMNKPEFISIYSAAKADILRNALLNLNARLTAAINTTAAIMNNTKNNPATRLQAAQTIINSAAKFTERLAQQEERSQKAANADLFDLSSLL